MRINGPQRPGTIAAPAGGALGPSLIDQIMEAEAAPLAQVEARKARVVNEKNEYTRLGGMLDALRGNLTRNAPNPALGSVSASTMISTRRSRGSRSSPVNITKLLVL